MNTKDCYQILRKELVPALGCTEPIAISFASAKAREVLGCFPERIELWCSGNIIKNVKGVTVPCSGGLKGLDVAAILGAIGGDASKELEVLSGVTAEDIEKTKALLGKKDFFECLLTEGKSNLYITVKMRAGSASSEVTIADKHTQITNIKKDGAVLFSTEEKKAELEDSAISRLSLEDVFTFAELADPDALAQIFDPQIELNSAISDYGLKNDCGANIGSTILDTQANTVATRAKARAAAASDARMSGCALPVVINSGSGNQGITVSLPVIEYANALGCSREKLYRALAVSNLSALYVKQYIGRLSAFCGAVVAASGASAAICYLHGGSHQQMANSIVNTLATVGGIVCDGAKPSCAAKIASAVDMAILGFQMSTRERNFQNGEGLVQRTPEDSIRAVGYMGRVGMAKTDLEILNIMLEKAEI